MHEHIDLLSDKTAPKKKRIWTGLFASGEAIALFFALSICFGAVTYLLLSFEPQPIWFGGSAALMSLSLFVLWRLQPAGLIRGFLIIIIGFQLGVLAGKVRTYVAAAPTILKPMGPVMLEGWLSAVEPAKKGVRLRIKPHAISGLASEDLPKTVRLTHRLSLQVAPGRYVRCWAVMRTPPGPAIPGDYNFRRQAWFEGLGAVGYVQGRCRGGVLGNPVSGWATFNLKIASARRRLAVFVHTAAGERAGGFAAALISGDRSFMATADQDVLRSSGLAHVLAISGLHLGIVGGLVYFLFRHGLAFIAPLSVRFPIQKPAAVAALIAITAYLIVSGASVSTQRAWIMSGVFFAAILFDRPALSLRSFSLAMISVVLLRPESVLLPGFQMSFAATGILIAVYENWSRKMAGVTAGMLSKARLFFASICVTSFAAFMATAPFAIFHFERVAPFGLIANFTAMPVIALLSVPSAALALLLTPFGYADIGLRLFGYSLELILFIANLASGQSLPLRFATTHMPEVSLGFFVLALISFLLLRRWLRALSVALFVAFGGECVAVPGAAGCLLGAFWRGICCEPVRAHL